MKFNNMQPNARIFTKAKSMMRCVTKIDCMTKAETIMRLQLDSNTSICSISLINSMKASAIALSLSLMTACGGGSGDTPKGPLVTETSTAGAATAGANTPGAVTSGADTPGAVTSGTATSGTATSGAYTAGTVTAGADTAGTATSGTGTSGTSATGTTTVGVTTSGTSTSGASTPELPQIIPTDEVRPFRPDSRYANVLKTCALIDYRTPCTLSTLPYIGHETENPTVEDILSRTLVTHDWMGVRLEELLTALPDDMLKLFRPVTSVLIGSEVRPSSFSSARGRMKIDAQHLWLSLNEKLTVSTEEDYRSNFGADLQFVSYWRIMRGEDYAVPYFSLTDESERVLEDILILAARPLYHELAHANDDLRPEDINLLSLDLTPAEAVEEYVDNGVAQRLYEDPSLTALNSDLYELARVRYADDPPTGFARNVQPGYVGSAFSNEGKQTFYGYYTIYEDVATLFAQAMLKFHFDVETHLGVTNKPQNHPDADCDEYLVAWGSRNRLAAPLVAARAKWVVEQIIEPSAELDEFFAYGLGDDAPLRVGDNWCDARFADPLIANARQRQALDNTDVLDIERKLFKNH